MKENFKISIHNLEKFKETEWDLGNQVLYDLCIKNPKHETIAEVIAKTCLIGRTYAAAIERGRNSNQDENDDFYISTVAKLLIESRIDEKIGSLKNSFKFMNEDKSIFKILEVHQYLNRLCEKMTRGNKEKGLYKRSFASKYLHFHLKNLFFIYDTRAVKAITKFENNSLNYSLHKKINYNKNIDKDYSKFYFKCLKIREELEEFSKIKISIRHFDNILLEISKEKYKVVSFDN